MLQRDVRATTAPVTVVPDAVAPTFSSAPRLELRTGGVSSTNEDGDLLGRDGCTAGVGDLIACRRNDYTLPVTNRAHYRVTAVGDDGSLIVQALTWDPAGGMQGTLTFAGVVRGRSRPARLPLHRPRRHRT